MTGDTTEEKVKIGGVEYVVDVGKMPYFAPFLRFQRLSGQCAESAVPEHEDLPFFAAIDQAVKHGYRRFFRGMPDSLDDYKVLCETLEHLIIDVLGGAGLNDVFADIRHSKDYSDLDDLPFIVKELKLKARDAAFKLLYLFILGEFGDDIQDSNIAFEATLFVVSHPSIFGCRTRKMVWQAYDDRFDATKNQRRELGKWHIPELEDDECSDETTESEGTGSYYSDMLDDMY